MWLGELITEKGIGNGISFIIFAGIVSRAPGGDRQLPRRRRTSRDIVLFAILGDRRGRGDHLHPGRPAPHPDPVRQPRPRPAHVPGRPDVPAAAGQPGRRHPDHLRDQHPAVPGPARRVLLVLARSRSSRTSRSAIVDVLQPHADPVLDPVLPADRRLHVLLHGVHVQARRDGRAAAQERRLHPGHPAGPPDAGLPRPGRQPDHARRRAVPRHRRRRAGRRRRARPERSAGLALGGTGLLIVVCVVVETMKQIEAQLMMRNYEGFIR